MDLFRETRCLFCEESITYRVGELVNLETHLTITHEVTSNQTFALYILFLNNEEIKEMKRRLEPRMRDLRSEIVQNLPSEWRPEISEQKDLDEIQARLMEQMTDSDGEEKDHYDEQEDDLNDHNDETNKVSDRNTRRKITNDAKDHNYDGEYGDVKDHDDETNKNSDINTRRKIKNESGIDKDDNVDQAGGNLTASKVEETEKLSKINLVERFEQLLQCKLCYTKCDTKDALERHKEVVHREDQRELAITFFTVSDLVYPCEDCPVRFISENILNRHRNSHHNIPRQSLTVTCDVCRKVMKYHSMKDHLKTHTEEKNYSCKLCYTTFKLERYLNQHQRKFHRDHAEYFNRDIEEADLKFDCRTCDKKFVTKDILEHHQAKAHSLTEQSGKSSKVSMKCFFCEETFNNGADRNKHCFDVHGKKDELVGDTHIKCMVCQKIVGKRKISEHKLRHVQVERFHCVLCYTSFSSQSNRRQHIKKIHNSDEEQQFLNSDRSTDKLEYECHRCSLKFLSEKLLGSHLSKCSGKTKKKKLKGFKIKKEPVNIKIKVEPVSSVQKCRLCYRNFTSRSNLRRHCEKVHGAGEEREFITKDITEADLRFNCKNCPKRFVTESLLTRHALKHSIKCEKIEGMIGNLKCYFCDENFSDGKKRIKHCYDQHGKKDEPIGDTKVKCMVCNKIFSRSHIQAHKTRHAKEKKYECLLCYLKFVNSKDRKSHERNVHKSEEEREFLLTNRSPDQFEFQCQGCDLKFLTKSLLLKHEKIHKLKTQSTLSMPEKSSRSTSSVTKKSARCKLCYKIFKNMTDHLTKGHRSEEEREFIEREISEADLKYPCSECPRKFVTKSLLTKHFRIHKLEEIGFVREACYVESLAEYRCILCYTQFKNGGHLLEHAVFTHQDEIHRFKDKPEPQDLKTSCPDCQLKFVSNNSLLYHQLRVHYVNDSLYCRLCQVTFKNSTGLLSHLKKHKDELELFRRTSEVEEKPFTCGTCDESYVSQVSLQYHSRKVHSMKIKEKEIKKSKKIKVRVKDISKAKKCFFCDETLDNRFDLNRHCWDVHAKRDEDIGGKKLKCMVCSKPVKRSKLWEHRLIHGEARKYSCRLCYKKFKQNTVLISHVKNIHQSAEEKEFLKHGVETDLIHGCGSCELKFLTEKLLSVHTTKEHGSRAAIRPVLSSSSVSQATTYCSLCYHDYSSSSNLKHHRRRVHTSYEEMKTFEEREIEPDRLNFSCQVCDKKFLTENILNFHTLYRHREGKKQDVSCDFCGRVFKWKNRKNLKNHLRDVHKVDDYPQDESYSGLGERDNAVNNFMSIFLSLTE